jgi:hypothetical protein
MIGTFDVVLKAYIEKFKTNLPNIGWYMGTREKLTNYSMIRLSRRRMIWFLTPPPPSPVIKLEGDTQ